MSLSIIGLILLIIAIIILYLYRNQRDKLNSILNTETSKIKDLLEEVTNLSKELNDKYTRKVEIKGTVESDKPLLSEIAKRECVYYQTTVSRKWEDTESYRDNDGNLHRRTITGEDILSSQKESTEFYVNDGTGKIKVIPDGAELYLSPVIDKFEPAENAQMGGTFIQFGNFKFNITNIPTARRTLGYHIKEEILPLNKSIYVLGTLKTLNNEVVISSSIDKNDKFIISVKSEEELIKELKSSSNILKIVSSILIPLSIILIILGFFIKF